MHVPAVAEVSASSAEPASARILRTARQPFRLGFARFTMDDLAAELGMSKKTLYLHFRSKDELLDALIDTKAASIRAGIDEIFATPATISERVSQLTRRLVTEISEINSIFLHDLRRFAPATYERLERVRAGIVPKVWERLLTEGIAAGEVRADIDIPFTARTVLVSLQAVLLPEHLEQFHIQPHEAVARFLQIVFAGLLTPAGRAEHEKKRIASIPSSPSR